MPTQRLSMRRIREVLRLRHQGLTERVIARMIGVSNGVVHGYLRRARLSGSTACRTFSWWMWNAPGAFHTCKGVVRTRKTARHSLALQERRFKT